MMHWRRECKVLERLTLFICCRLIGPPLSPSVNTTWSPLSLSLIHSWTSAFRQPTSQSGTRSFRYRTRGSLIPVPDWFRHRPFFHSGTGLTRYRTFRHFKNVIYYGRLSAVNDMQHSKRSNDLRAENG